MMNSLNAPLLLKKANHPLLPDELAPVDDRQRELTERYLLPLQTEIFDLLLSIRSNLDPVLSRKFPQCAGKPYPLGRCLEITNAVRRELLIRLSKPHVRAEAALRMFLESGGVVRPIWGALRGMYFQNATQIGGLYIDVSNDTVNVNKPKIEICSVDVCDLIPIQNIMHFIEVAKKYWEIDVYVNSCVPTLSPLFPIIGVPKVGNPSLLIANDYMIALSMREQFHDAERWLMQGPLPPDGIVHKIRQHLPKYLLPDGNIFTVDKSVEICQMRRNEKRYIDYNWRNSCIHEYIMINKSINDG
jgi:hypothetical protein